jgi:hypothetical protein
LLALLFPALSRIQSRPHGDSSDHTEMSSNVPATTLSPKTINAPSYSNFPSYSQTGLTSANDVVSQRRSGSSGSFGAGSSTRSTPQARNNQPLRKKNKVQRRTRLVDEDAIAESAAMKSINSRKGQTSITHLMNFSLPPRPYFQNHQNIDRRRHQHRNPTWGLGSGYHAIDKARYVHANYRFIVKPDRSYHAQAVDADVHLEWDSILQILASAETQSTSCPICLSTPVAPRMAKCGHIFCLPCLIRYMHSTDDSNPAPEKRARWKKCPICEDSIYISETKPVRWFVGQQASMLQEGGDVLLKLLARDPGSTLALPRDVGERREPLDDIPWYHTVEIMDYARFMKGGEDYMILQYDAEIKELEVQEKEDELMFGDDTTWTKKAVAAINDSKAKLNGMGNPPDAPTEPTERRISRPPINFEPTEDVPEMYMLRPTSTTLVWRSKPPSSTAAAAGQSVTPGIPTNKAHADHPPQLLTNVKITHPQEPEPTQQQTNAGPQNILNARPSGGPFFFYNVLPNFYLSPLDIRILKAAFGPFSSFPSTILPRVEHISTGHIVDDEIRKRAKYLAHLPYGCEVSFLECDWTDVIAPNVLAQFTSDIERRRKRHHEKEAREERDRVRAEKEEEEKRYAAARRRRPSGLEKSFSETDFQPLAQADGAFGGSPSNSHAISMTPPWGGATRTHSSFATLGSPGTSPEAPRTVWGTAVIPPSSPPMIATPQETATPDDGWLQGWEKDLLDNGDPIAMIEANISGEGSSRSGTGVSGKHKKKNKKITLMSTNARRGA